MERIVHIAKNHKEAEEWDILQQISMTPEERQRIAKELKRKVYHNTPKDMREINKTKK